MDRYNSGGATVIIDMDDFVIRQEYNQVTGLYDVCAYKHEMTGNRLLCHASCERKMTVIELQSWLDAVKLIWEER